MTDNISAAAAAAYRGKTVVVKYGGNAIADPELQRAVIDDIAFLHGAGVRVILVHGGGSEINAMLGRVGIEPRFVDGLRYTDPDTMEIVQMVLCGKINKQLAAQLSGRGAKALGLSGMDCALLRARRRTDRDLGLVGEVTGVDAAALIGLLEQSFLPVISTVAMGEDGGALNINADTAAAAIAVSIGADRLALITDVKGVLRDKNDESTLIRALHVEEIADLVESGVIAGGMLPKIDCCAGAVRGGVRGTAILDGREKHAVLRHLAGIGGVSMCALAEVLQGMGLVVQGSDMTDGGTTVL